MKMTRENAVEINEWMGDLDTAISRLTEYRNNGQSVYVEFNGHKLYSCDITPDSAYQEVAGMTKAEFDKKKQEWLKRVEREEKEGREKAEKKIPEWIRKGNESIYPERAEEWKHYVEASARQGIYIGRDIDDTLEIMNMLDSGTSFEEVEKKLDDQEHSGSSYSMVTQNILKFSKRGPDFYEQVVLKGKSDPESMKVIDKIRKENNAFEKSLNNNMESKEDTPYNKVLKRIINTNVLSEDRKKAIENYVKNTMNNAINGILLCSMGNKEENKKDLENFIFNGGKSSTLENIKKNSPMYESVGVYLTTDYAILDSLLEIYNGRAKENQIVDKNNNKKYVIPKELAGWNDIKRGMEYIKPIFEAVGINIDEEKIQNKYNNETKDFLLKNGIINKEDLAKTIEEKSGMDESIVRNEIVPQIEKSGIGDIKENVKKMYTNTEIDEIIQYKNSKIESINKNINNNIEKIDSNSLRKMKIDVIGLLGSVRDGREIELDKEIEKKKKIEENKNLGVDRIMDNLIS